MMMVVGRLQTIITSLRTLQAFLYSKGSCYETLIEIRVVPISHRAKGSPSIPEVKKNGSPE